MPRSRAENITIAFFILVLCFITYFVYKQWQQVREGDYLSCLGSVSNEIQKLEATKDLTSKNNDWKILNEDEVKILMQQVQSRKCVNSDNPVLDIWNHRINIALRKPANFQDIIIWSNGRDGISGTTDDLVMPFGEKVPGN